MVRAGEEGEWRCGVLEIVVGERRVERNE